MLFELTPSQRSFYTGESEIDTYLWNQGVMQVFPCKYSYEELNNAFNTLVKNNDSLRVKMKHVERAPVMCLECYSYRMYPRWVCSSMAELENKAKEFLNSSIDFSGDLVRCAIFETPDASGIVISGHHIVVDGYSVIVMAEHLNEYLKNPLYNPPAYQSYSEYVEGEEEYRITRRYQLGKDFWRSEFTPKPVCSLFSDSISAIDYVSSEENTLISSSLFDRIKKFCIESDISVQSFFNTVYSVYFYRTTEHNGFTLGIPVLNRTTAAELNTIGLYMHIVPLVVEIDSGTFLDNALKVENSQLNLFRYQKFTQTEIIKTLQESGTAVNRLFDVATDFQQFEYDSDYEIKVPYCNYLSLPLEIHMQSFGKAKHQLKIRYRTSMFTEKEIQTMMSSIIAIAEDALAYPDKKISELNMISSDEQKLLATFNNTQVPYDKHKCIHELYEEQVERTPDKVALVAADKALTYKELNEEANRIAHSLIEKGIGRGDIVGLMLPRESYLLSALLGILKTGAAYLPIDPEHPAERIEYMLSDSRAKYCITDENIFEFLSNTDVTNPVIETSSNDICYCIYTSGSTGKPKGALIYHRNLVWYMSVLENIYGTDNINMPFFTSQSVDLTVPSFCFPLLTGGATYLYNGELKDDLIDIFDNDELTIIKFTPTHMNIICNTVPSKLRPNIRCIIVGGETLYREACFEFLNKFGNHIEIHNEYGPTETTVSCTDFIFNPGENKNMQHLPIGRPVANTQIYILDKHMNPVPLGVTGEVCIAGDGVGAGYLNNPELTAEKFVDNPFGEGKLYRTGDNAYWCEDGNIVFVGRNDFQVKIRGLRIELGEIESALQNIEGIERAVVVVRENSENRQFICAFYTGEEKSAKDLRAEMGASLPKYMLPHIFTRLDETPLTASGKVNRNALPEIDLECISTETEHKAPETEEEKALSEAVCSVLNVSSINMLDNFFNIGGDSIRAIYIVAELADMGYELRVADIMQSDTFSDVAEFVKAAYDNAVYEQNEVNGLMPFSPIMRAFLKRSNTIPENYVHTCVFEADCDEITAKKALDVLVSHHDILRGVFRDNGIQVIPSDERKAYSFEVLTIDDADKAKDYLNKAKISKDKLVNIVFCNTKKENLVSMTVHHFLIDLVSWEILIKDFQTAVRQINNKEQILLPAKTASFMLWCEELQKYSETISAESKAYWEDVNQKLNNTKSVNFNVYAENEAEEYNFTFDENVSNKLINEVTNVYGARINEVLLTALGLAVGKITGGSVGIIVESHGRAELEKHIAVERTVGWFTSCYPIIIDNNNEVEALINTKETLRRIPKNGIDYLLLNEGFNENIDVKFNFYRSNTAEDASGNKLMAFNYEMSVFPGFTNVNCFIEDNILSVNISVPYGRHREMLAKELTEEFVKQTERLVEICTGTDTVVRTLSDFSDNELTEDELDELKDLFDWTDANEQ